MAALKLVASLGLLAILLAACNAEESADKAAVKVVDMGESDDGEYEYYIYYVSVFLLGLALLCGATPPS